MNKTAILERLNKMCENTLNETLEIKYIDVGEDFLAAKMPVNSRVHQPDGILKERKKIQMEIFTLL